VAAKIVKRLFRERGAAAVSLEFINIRFSPNSRDSAEVLLRNIEPVALLPHSCAIEPPGKPFAAVPITELAFPGAAVSSRLARIERICVVAE
jgi:hypothetical protein